MNHYEYRPGVGYVVIVGSEDYCTCETREEAEDVLKDLADGDV